MAKSEPNKVDPATEKEGQMAKSEPNKVDPATEKEGQMAKSEPNRAEPTTDDTKVAAIDGKVTELPTPEAAPTATAEELDAEEQEFRALRRDLPGVKGANAAGIVTISVGKIPMPKNEFFRSHPDFRPTVSLVDHEVGIEKQFFAVTPDMVVALAGIGISVADYTLYLTITARGAMRIVPVRQANSDGEQNEFHRTKEIGLMQAVNEWVRLFTDQENRCYQVFPAPAGRFTDPQWPVLKEAKIFRLAFRDKGRLIDSVEHTLFQKWAARDK
jgi:hypothetical protein